MHPASGYVRAFSTGANSRSAEAIRERVIDVVHPLAAHAHPVTWGWLAIKPTWTPYRGARVRIYRRTNAIGTDCATARLTENTATSTPADIQKDHLSVGGLGSKHTNR